MICWTGNATNASEKVRGNGTFPVKQIAAPRVRSLGGIVSFTILVSSWKNVSPSTTASCSDRSTKVLMTNFCRFVIRSTAIRHSGRPGHLVPLQELQALPWKTTRTPERNVEPRNQPSEILTTACQTIQKCPRRDFASRALSRSGIPISSNQHTL